MLAALRRAGPPYELSPGRLVRETLVTSGTMTNRVDRLAARARRRLADPGDRRGVLVRLTPGARSRGRGVGALLDRERGPRPGPERDQTRLAGLLRPLLSPFADSG